MLGSSVEMDGLTEGDWDKVSGELEMLDGIVDG